jgi:hypothetical protein
MTLLETYLHVIVIPLTVLLISAQLIYKWIKRKQDR